MLQSQLLKSRSADELTIGVLRHAIAWLHFGMQTRVKQLSGCRGAEELDEGGDDGLPLLWGQFSDVVLEELLEARCPDPSKCIVFCQ